LCGSMMLGVAKRPSRTARNLGGLPSCAAEKRRLAADEIRVSAPATE
jgi:hypothetical protein